MKKKLLHAFIYLNLTFYINNAIIFYNQKNHSDHLKILDSNFFLLLKIHLLYGLKF